MTAIRRPGAASAAALIGLTLSLVVVHTIDPDWACAAGVDVWNLSALERDCQAAAEEQDEVDDHGERCARRRETANQIAAQLVADTTTLPTATDQLRVVFADDAALRDALVVMHPTAPTSRLRFARHAIERALRLVANDLTQTEIVTARLEAEYCAMVAAELAAAP